MKNIYFFCLLLLFLQPLRASTPENQKGFEIMNKKQFRQLINFTLQDLGLHSKSAVELLMLTSAQESHLGRYLWQKGFEMNTNRGALGVFQMETLTHDDIHENYLKYKPDILNKIKDISGIERISAEMLIYNLKYAVCMTRIHYLRVSEPLPDGSNIKTLANYWKKYYNTEKGKGTPDEAIKNYNRFCLPRG